MKIKRILACVCASMLMALSFTACGDSDKKSDKSSSEVVTEAPTEAATEAETTADSSSAADSNAGGTNGQVNALDATTNGYNQTTGYSDMQGLTFAAVIVKNGTTLYPNMIISIDSIKLDGKEIEMTKKPYTSSDDGKEMRSNIYNSYVNADEVASDARTADGDLTNCSPQVVDPASFATYQKIEVTFTVSGL